MQIITYTNTAEVIRLDKSNYLSNRQELDIPERFVAGQDITAPTISISSPTIPTFNYVYIPTFGRYYFASTPVWEGSNLWSIPLLTDLLYSFKDKILNLHAIASRLEDQGKHSMIIDDRITAEATQYEDIDIVPMVAVDNKKFDIQDNDNQRIVFSCFSGDTFIDGDLLSIQIVNEDNTVTYPISPAFSSNTLYYSATLPRADKINIKMTSRATGYQLDSDIPNVYYFRSGGDKQYAETIAEQRGDIVYSVAQNIYLTNAFLDTINIELNGVTYVIEYNYL